MEFVRLDPQTVLIRDIDPFAAELLRRIPLETEPGDDQAARGRLFSKPAEEGRGRKARELNEEWRQYVEPELRHLFQSANETVSADLEHIRRMEHGADDGETYALDIPANHLEQWLNSLNQARLVMAARNAFTDEELADKYPSIINTPRDMNLFQIHFYGLIQEFLVHEIEGEPPR